MLMRFFIQPILLLALISSSPLFASTFTNEEKAEIKVLYRMASKMFRGYLNIKSTSNGDRLVRDKFAQTITQELDNSFNNLDGQLKRHMSNNLQWYGQTALDTRHPKNKSIKTQILGESDGTAAYYTGSIDALEYSASMFLIRSCEAVLKVFFEHFDVGHNDKKTQFVFHPKSGIAKEEAMQSGA